MNAQDFFKGDVTFSIDTVEALGDDMKEVRVDAQVDIFREIVRQVEKRWGHNPNRVYHVSFHHRQDDLGYIDNEPAGEVAGAVVWFTGGRDEMVN